MTERAERVMCTRKSIKSDQGSIHESSILAFLFLLWLKLSINFSKRKYFSIWQIAKSTFIRINPKGKRISKAELLTRKILHPSTGYLNVLISEEQYFSALWSSECFHSWNFSIFEEISDFLLFLLNSSHNQISSGSCLSAEIRIIF